MSGPAHDRGVQNDEAFRRIFDEFWAPVRHHIECVIDDDDEVSALVAEVFLDAWAKLDPRRPIGLIWLLRTSDRKLKGRERRVSRRAAPLDAVRRGIDEGTDPEPGSREAVLKAIASLKPLERRIIMLTYWDGLAPGETAQLLRTSRARVWITLSRARHDLRVQLGLPEEGGNDA